MENILITGVAGNIGSSLSKFLLNSKKNINVIGIDNFLTGKYENLPNHKNFIFYELDVNFIERIEPIFEKFDINYIFHYAACAGVDRTLDDPFKVFNDVVGINNIASLAIKYKVNKIAYASSSEVYGENGTIPYCEKNTPINPKLPYATVKAYGESVFLSLSHRYKLNTNIFRFFNTYGPVQSNDYVIKRFIEKAQNNLPISIYGSGEQTRTFLFIDDNLSATCNAFFQNKFNNEPINIGSDIMFKIIDLAKLIIKLCDSKSNIEFLGERSVGDTKLRQPVNNNFRKLLQKDPLSLEDGLKKIIYEKK